MPFNRWNPEIKKKIDAFIEKSRQEKGRKIAVFDADGTVWNHDVGEGFFQYQIKNRLIPPKNYPSGVDLWQKYLKGTEVDAKKTYSWLAQLQNGVPESELRKWCRNFFEKTFRTSVHMEMAKLILALRREDFEVWLCSASMRWAVEPGAMALQIDQNKVVAIETEVAGGVVTDRLIEPVPFKEGKRKALEKALGGKPPLFVAGNSNGDTAMLEYARDFRLVTASSTPGGLHYESEQALQKIAKERGWPIQDFTGPGR